MSVSHKWTWGLKRDEGSLSIAETAAPASSIEVPLDLNLAAAATRVEVATSVIPSKIQSLLIYGGKSFTMYVNGTDEIQQVAITGTPTGGTFTLTYSGQTTAAIAYNATATAVQAALAALSNIGTGNVTCAGGPLPGTAVTVAFSGTLGLQDVATMTHTDSLTGGSTPAAAITTPTPGVAPTQTFSFAANVPLIWLADWAPFYAVPFSSTVSKLSFTNGSSTAAAAITARILSTP